MAQPALISAYVSGMKPEDLRLAMKRFVPPGIGREKRTEAIRSLLESPQGKALRAELGRWIVVRFPDSPATVCDVGHGTG